MNSQYSSPVYAARSLSLFRARALSLSLWWLRPRASLPRAHGIFKVDQSPFRVIQGLFLHIQADVLFLGEHASRHFMLLWSLCAVLVSIK